jgi:hypothetical protein
MFPEVAPKVEQIKSQIRDIGLTIMKSQHPGEPMAPPSGGA